MPLVFPVLGACINRGAVPLDRGRRPRRPARTLQDADPICSRCGTKASRADRGVCPTTSAALPIVEKRVALAWQAARRLFTGATCALGNPPRNSIRPQGPGPRRVSPIPLSTRRAARSATFQVATSASLPTFFKECPYKYRLRQAQRPRRAALYRLDLHASRCTIALPAEFPQQPGLAQAPVAQHGTGRNVQHVGAFLHAESTKEAQFHYLRLPRVDLRQRAQSIVECH